MPWCTVHGHSFALPLAMGYGAQRCPYAACSTWLAGVQGRDNTGRAHAACASDHAQFAARQVGRLPWTPSAGATRVRLPAAPRSAACVHLAAPVSSAAHCTGHAGASLDAHAVGVNCCCTVPAGIEASTPSSGGVRACCVLAVRSAWHSSLAALAHAGYASACRGLWHVCVTAPACTSRVGAGLLPGCVAQLGYALAKPTRHTSALALRERECVRHCQGMRGRPRLPRVVFKLFQVSALSRRVCL